MKVRSLDVTCDVCGDGIVWRRAQRAGQPFVDPPPLSEEERALIATGTTAAARFALIHDVIVERARRRHAAEARETPAPQVDGGVPWAGVGGWQLSPDRDLCPVCASKVVTLR